MRRLSRYDEDRGHGFSAHRASRIAAHASGALIGTLRLFLAAASVISGQAYGIRAQRK